MMKKSLDLSQQCLTSISAEIADLTDVSELYIYSNALTEIPETIAALQDLTILDAAMNQIQHLAR